MRKVVLYVLMALDGAVDRPSLYFAGGNGPDAPPAFDETMERNQDEVTATQDAVVIGRRLYDEWSTFWPTVRNENFATFINAVKKYVVTSTPLLSDWNNSEAVDGPAEDLVRRLREQPGGDIGVHGSIEVAQSLLNARLVDELQLVVSPAFGFPGRRLFDAAKEVQSLELLSAKASPSGSLMLAYRVR